jgi:PAS domain-containing protein
VTAQLRAEEQLRIAATAFETHGAIAIADRECHILQINEAFTELTQYPQTEMVGCLPEVLKSDRHKDPFYQDIWYEVGQFGRWEGDHGGLRRRARSISLCY